MGMRTFNQIMLAAGLAVAVAAPAQATIYDYTMAGNSGLTIANVGVLPGQPPFTGNLLIDTAAGTGTLTGDNGAININFTGNFAGFMGGAAPMNMYNVVINPASSITVGGHTYSLVAPASTHPDMVEFMGSYINLWAEWSSPGCSTCKILGDTIGNITGGGTPVPEPGMVGLMALGVAGLAWQRRRKAPLALA